MDMTIRLRVACQAALALAFIGMGFITSAFAQSAQAPQRECVYDYTMATHAECLAFRDRMLAANSRDERDALRDAFFDMMEQRARERGVRMHDWRGLTLAPLNAAASGEQGPACALDYPILTENECRTYHGVLVRAKTERERSAVLYHMRNAMHTRARQRGAALNDWRSYLPALTTANVER